MNGKLCAYVSSPDRECVGGIDETWLFSPIPQADQFLRDWGVVFPHKNGKHLRKRQNLVILDAYKFVLEQPLFSSENTRAGATQQWWLVLMLDPFTAKKVLFYGEKHHWNKIFVIL